MRMGALTYEPDMAIQEDEEVWFALTGGTTEPALRAFRRFLTKRLPWGWKFERVQGRAKYPIQRKHGDTEETVVFLTFVGHDDSRVTFGTDGFSWGYGGTGPSGLADILAESIHGPVDPLHHQHSFPIRQFIERLRKDADWTAYPHMLSPGKRRVRIMVPTPCRKCGEILPCGEEVLWSGQDFTHIGCDEPEGVAR